VRVMVEHAKARFRARKIAVCDTAETRLRELAQEGEAVVFDLAAESGALRAACAAARAGGVPVRGWIEVGRDEAAAGAHPEWMHAPQHHEWLQAFPNWGGGRTALVAPWICVNNRAAFDYALNRVCRLVEAAPPLDGLFLNDIQGPPAGCGCGNVLCRSWDNSPGAKIAPAPYQNPDVFFSQVFWRACADAIANLSVNALPPSRVFPVICGECEIGVTMGGVESPDERRGTCRGIPCSRPCALVYWPGLVRSLAAERGRPSAVGLLTPYRLFDRDTPLYGGTAAWVGASAAHYREYDPNASLIAVVQGWDVTQDELAAQKEQAIRNGAAGLLVLEEPLEQSWWPVAPPADYVPSIPPVLCGA
jgi:hypothetical protein